MNLERAILEGVADALPSRRDEDWRWSDLRGLLRVVPPPAQARSAGADPAPGPGPEGFEGPVRDFIDGPPAARAAPAGGRLIRRFHLTQPGRSVLLADDLVVGPGETLELLDDVRGADEGLLLVQGRIEVRAGGRLERLVVADDPEGAVTVAVVEVDLEAGAVFGQTTLGSGGRRQRLETRVEAAGDAEVRLDGAFAISGRRHGDQTTRLRHAGLRGRSRQLVKGLVGEQGRSVFQGRIVVARGADGTDARMGCHALVLSDRAEADAKPELEIYADDVQCAHGATVGALDAEAVFYMGSRGVPEDEARRLLAGAFVGEVLERMGEGALRSAAEAAARRLMERVL